MPARLLALPRCTDPVKPYRAKSYMESCLYQCKRLKFLQKGIVNTKTPADCLTYKVVSTGVNNTKTLAMPSFSGPKGSEQIYFPVLSSQVVIREKRGRRISHIVFPQHDKDGMQCIAQSFDPLVIVIIARNHSADHRSIFCIPRFIPTFRSETP